MRLIIYPEKLLTPLRRPMPKLKNRIYVAACLLAAVLIFNIGGYYFIHSQTKQDKQIEAGFTVLNDLQGQVQDISQAIITLTIHQSFSASEQAEKVKALQPQIARFRTDCQSLQNIIYSKQLKNDELVNLARKLFADAGEHINILQNQATAVLTDTSKKYVHDYGFNGQVRSNESSLRTIFRSLGQTLIAAEQEKDAAIGRMNTAIIISLFGAVLFIVLTLVASIIRITRKNYDQLQQSQKLIRESEQKYRNLFHNNPVPMWIYDLTTFRFLEVNQMAVQHYGYTEQEFLAMTVFDIRSDTEKKRLQRLVHQNSADLEHANLRGTWNHMKKNGEQIFVDIISHKIRYNDTEAMLILANDITRQIELQTQLMEEKIIRQKEIARATIDVQEKERNAIGRELHDNINQILTCARLQVEYAAEENDAKELSGGLRLIDKAIAEIRNLSHAFVPPHLEDDGLITSIETLLQNITAIKLQSDFFHDGLKEEYLEEGLKLTIYRIVQEQITNIIKYASATHIKVELLHHDELLTLSISDNGKGFDTSRQRKGVGITNMKNRAEIYQGKLHIESRPGKGCTLCVDFRLKNVKSKAA
jgi:PAS domain S-box-containing protein